MHTFPLFCSMRCYACHACLCHPLAFYASLHTCLHVHAWVLLASVSSMLQHNEVMDIQSKPTFLPRRHLILFAFSLVCLLYCSFACYAYHAYLLYDISYALHTSSFHCLSAVFLIFAFASTHIEQGRMELGHGLLGTSMSIRAKRLCLVGLGVQFSDLVI